MSTDDLISALCAGGRVDSHGSFTLDREQAREKLRAFQVAEPHRYVLHIVALAVLRGATALDFEIDSDDLWARFDGAPLSAQDFEDLYGASFAESPDDVERARQQLALAIHAALALEPRRVSITSGPPEARVRLVARPGAEDRVEQAAAGEGTEIHVKLALGSVVGRFFRRLRGQLPEVLALRERARHAPIPITLGGEGLSAGIAAAVPGLTHAITLADTDGRTCFAGMRPGPCAELRLVRHGVWIETLAPAHLPGEAYAVVVDDALPTDLSATQVVRAERFAGCVALAEEAIERAMVAWVATLGDGPPPAHVRPGLRQIWREWPRARAADGPLARALAALPWFTDMFERTWSFEQVAALAAGRGGVGFTTVSFAGELQSWDEVILMLAAPTRGEAHPDLLLLRDLLGAQLRDHTRLLEHAARREANRRRWRASPAKPRLPIERHTAIRELRAGSAERPITGLVGLRALSPDPSTLRALADGHALAERRLALPSPLPLDIALDGLDPDAEFTGPRLDGRLALALLAALDAALGLVEDVLSRSPEPADRHTVQRYLELRHDPAGPLAWLEAFGFSLDVTLRALGAPELEAMPRIAREVSTPPLDRVLEPWIAEAIRIQTTSASSLSLGAIALALLRGQEVVAIDILQPMLPSRRRITLRVDADDAALVRRVFGPQIPILSREEITARAAEEMFLRRPVEDPALDEGGGIASVRVVDGPLSAVLSLLSVREGEAPLRARVRVLVLGRLVCERTMAAPFAGIRVILRDDRLSPTATYDAVIEDEAWTTATAAVRAAVPRLVSAAIEAVQAGAPAWPLAEILAASFPTEPLRAAWERIERTEPPALAMDVYGCLLALAATIEPYHVDAALSRALDDGEGPLALTAMADRLQARLDPALGRTITTQLAAIRQACGQGAGGLAEAVSSTPSALLEALDLLRADGGRTTVLALRDAVARGEAVELGESQGRAADALCVTAHQASFLRRFFGAAHFVAKSVRAAAETPSLDLLELLGAPRGEGRRSPAWTTLPAAPADALVCVTLDEPAVYGSLWLPRDAEESACRAQVFDADGTASRRVSLMQTLPLAGALAGPGVEAGAYAVRLTPDARQAVERAARRLYEALLARADADADRACKRLSGRIGAGRLPPEFEDVRRELGRRAAAAPEEAVGGGAVLEAMFEELEAEARAAGERAARRGAATKEPAPSARALDAQAAASPAPPPEEQLLEAIRGELRALRERHERLLSNFNLEHLRGRRMSPRSAPVMIADGITLNLAHPLVQQAAAAFTTDPAWVDVLASLVFTAFNVWRHEITDADEQDFHRLQLARLAARSRST